MGLGSQHQHFSPALGRQRLMVCLLLTFGFFLVELVGGFLTNSLALLSDAGHMLSDVGTLAFSLTAIWWAAKPPTPTKTFGYHRLEILAALINGLVLWGIAAVIIIEGYQRWLAPPPVRSGLMFFIATAGLGVNLLAAWLLFPAQKKSINIRSAFLHVLADGLGSLGAVAASLAMLWRGWYWFDPLASFFIAILIVLGSWHLVKEAADILMESTPRHIDLQAVKEKLLAVPGVIDLHELHIWSIASGLYAISLHAVIADNCQPEEVRCRLEDILHDGFGLEHTTIQIETQGFSCPDYCLWHPQAPATKL